ncbi:MAG: polysaccharide pyruvyl transferase CsaB [Abditibacteriota bacterium]|nr:polysaccharide pyruvyl transferase CsaB [Abditibacteriota bacterium]
MKKLLISGFYGYGNGGDEAVLSGIIASLREAGLHRITVLSADRAYTEALHGVPAAPRMSPATLKAIADCDVFISGGGSLFQNATSSRSLYYYLALLLAAMLLGKKTVVFAQGIGPLSGQQHISRTMSLLRKVSLVSVRDADSASFLAKYGIDARVVPDPAFLCSSKDPEQVLAAAGITGDYFTVCPRPWKDNSYLEPLTAAIEQYARSTGLQPLCLPMFFAEDRLIAGVASVDGPLDFAMMRGVIARSRVIVGVRLHSLILAAAEQVPFVAISYDPKIDAFSRACGQEPLEIDSLTREALLARLAEPGLSPAPPDKDSLMSFADSIARL